MTADMLEVHTEGFSDGDRRAVLLMLKALAPQRAACTDAAAMLAAAGAPVNGTTIRDARVHILLARAEAQDRVGLFNNSVISATGHPIAELLDDKLVTTARGGTPATSSPELNDTPYLTLDTRRFSEIIDRTVAAIQTAGDWNHDVAQRRRVMEGFAWIASAHASGAARWAS